MATEKQIEANRQNAIRSTGPKTADGKARSSMNARTHGLSGEELHVDLYLSAQFVERISLWTEEINPETDEAKYALERAVAASFRVAQCEKTFDAMMVEEATKAALSYDLDQRIEVATLADKLSKKPMLHSAQLEATPQGIAYKLDAIGYLGEVLDTNGTWTEAERSSALDLLGVGRERRAGCTVLEPRNGDDTREHRRNVLYDEIERLNVLKTSVVDPLDELRRRQARLGSTAMFSTRAALIQRYEREADRKFRAAMRVAKGGLNKTEKSAESIQLEEAFGPKSEPVDDGYEAWAKGEGARRKAAIDARIGEVGARFAAAMTVEERQAIATEFTDSLRAKGTQFDENGYVIDEPEMPVSRPLAMAGSRRS